MRLSALAVFVSVSVGPGCAHGDVTDAHRVLTSAPDGWVATAFAYREYQNDSNLETWELETDTRYDGATRWTFGEARNPQTAASLEDRAVGEVVAPDGWVTAFDWEVEPGATFRQPVLTLFLYEDAVFHQGDWAITLTEYDAAHMRWEILAENVDHHRVEAELELAPR